MLVLLSSILFFRLTFIVIKLEITIARKVLPERCTLTGLANDLLVEGIFWDAPNAKMPYENVT